MGVALVAEEDPAPSDLFVLIDRARRVPEVGGELAVSAGEELVALGFVLADEEDVRWVATGSQRRTPLPPRAEAGSQGNTRMRGGGLLRSGEKPIDRNRWREHKEGNRRPVWLQVALFGRVPASG